MRGRGGRVHVWTRRHTMLCKSDQVDEPISSRVGGHAVYLFLCIFFSSICCCFFFKILLLDDDAPSTFLPTRCNAADNADLVSSHAGLSQSSPPLIDFSNDASLSLLLLLDVMVFYCNIRENSCLMQFIAFLFLPFSLPHPRVIFLSNTHHHPCIKLYLLPICRPSLDQMIRYALLRGL